MLLLKSRNNQPKHSTILQETTEQHIIKNLQYSPNYKNGLSNHLSMPVFAPHHIGATNIQINKFVKEYSVKLESISTQTNIISLQQKHLQIINNNDKNITPQKISNSFKYHDGIGIVNI